MDWQLCLGLLAVAVVYILVSTGIIRLGEKLEGFFRRLRRK